VSRTTEAKVGKPCYHFFFKAMEAEYVIGIDLGTTNSCVGVWKHGRAEIIPNDMGERTTPSMVTYLSNDESLVGVAAKNQRQLNPQNTVFAIKRIIGRNFNDPECQEDLKRWPFKVVSRRGNPHIEFENSQGEKKTVPPEWISSLVLTLLKNSAETFCGQKVGKAVITCPAYFNESQRLATKHAAEISGLQVLSMINEPTAAAIAYGFANTEKEATVVVFDFGGGTLDVSLLTVEGNEEFIVQATAGNTNLGGEDLDTSLINHCLAEFKRLHNVDLSQNSRALARLKEPCENAKIALSTSMDTTIFINSFYEGQDLSVTVSRAKFEAMNSSLFQNILKPVEMVLSEAKVKKSEVDHVILVGGSSKIPKIQNILSQFFGGKKLNHTVNPDEAIAYGATLQAACLSFGIGSPDINFLLQDVTAFSLGIETNQGMSKIITRNSTLPISHTKRYETVEDNQTSVAINAYQGEEIDVTRNYYLGSFVLNVPALPKGQAKLDVTFRIDASGLLNVKAISLDGGKTESMKIIVKNNHLAYEEIAHLAAEQRKMTVTTKRPIKQDQNGLD